MQELLEKEAIISSDHHGKRVDVVLAQLFPDYSRSQLTQWLKEGLITLNATVHKPKDKVVGGERVVLRVLQQDLFERHQAEAIPLSILFEDDYILILNKPAGLVVHPGAGNPQHTLVNALLHHDESLQLVPRAGIVHRLDKDTTGLLIVAKTLEAHTHLIRMMQARDIQRRYQALVYGHLISGGYIETCYGRHPRSRLKMAVCKQGKEAITEYTLKKQYQDFTLLDVKLYTGRTHQIRVHMAHINHPVVGDQLYGGRARFPAGCSDEVRQQLLAFKRQALHACYLSFVHPVTHEELLFEAPLPPDFQSFIDTLDAVRGG